MSNRYAISQANLEPFGNFATLAEARAELSLIRQASLNAARKRYGKAYLHNHGDCFEITLAPDRRSTLWTRAGIVSA
jgi:uncharacterized protein with PIN domain